MNFLRSKASKGLAVLVLLGGGLAAVWFVRPSVEAVRPKAAPVFVVQSALVSESDVPVRLSVTGTVSARQTVEVRARLSASVLAVHVKEGQVVRAGQRLFTLDVRSEAANQAKAEAQWARSRVDLANAERNLLRQRELFGQKFIAQNVLDNVQSQVDSLKAQVVADASVVESSRVAHGFGEVLAPIAGRLGSIAVFPGSLVQASGPALLTIAQIDSVLVSFALPERELPELQKGLAQGGLPVSVQIEGSPERQGRLSFIDNSVDSVSGSIHLKALFANADGRLWPGMFVNVALAPRSLAKALTLPVQAVQTGPEKKFVYVIGEDNKVSVQPVRVRWVQDGRAVVEGVAKGTKVVLEGAQNLRPGSVVSLAKP